MAGANKKEEKKEAGNHVTSVNLLLGEGGGGC